MSEIIDAWMQHPTPRFSNHDMFESLRRWMGTDEIPPVPLEMTIASMDAAGVDRSLASAWSSPEGDLISNDELAGFVDESNGRLIGVGTVDLRRPADALAEVRRCVNDLGFKAIRVLPWVWERPPDHRSFYPVYVACCEADVPFCLQVGHTGPMRASEFGRPIPHLDRVALDFPDLTLVGGHIGYPWTTEMIALATKYPNVYIDTSAYKATRFPAELVSYMRAHGRRKVLFGTNYPMIQPADCLAGLDALDLDDEARSLFLSGNARRIFGLDA